MRKNTGFQSSVSSPGQDTSFFWAKLSLSIKLSNCLPLFYDLQGISCSFIHVKVFQGKKIVYPLFGFLWCFNVIYKLHILDDQDLFPKICLYLN